MGFFDDLIGSVTGQQGTPQQTIIPTEELLQRGLSTANSLAPQVAALNKSYQPIFTGNQLASEQQVFGDAANQLQRGAYQSILDELNLGNSVSPELQDLITTNTLSQLGTSGLKTSDAGKIFGARSLLSAGIDLGRQRRGEALNASNLLPSSRLTPQVIGVPNPMEISGMIEQEQAAKDNYANVVEDIRRSNFSSLINTGGRILGTAAGAFFGGPMGASIGGNIGGSLFGRGGVAGVNSGGQSGGGGSPFTSILSGLFGGGGAATPGINPNVANAYFANNGALLA